MNVLIAGCGYVGSALAEELIRTGDRVWGLRRSAGDLPPGVLPVIADLTRPETLDAIDESIDHLVYAASPRDRSDRAYEDAYVRGVENLLSVLERRATLRRAVLTSSTAVYAQDDGGWIDESSPTEPARFAGRALLRGEALLRGRGFEGIALRLSGIYGPGRTWLVRRVANGEARVGARGASPRCGNRIHRDDCAGSIAHLLQVPDVAPIYVGVDEDPAPLAAVYRFVAELLGVEPPAEGESDEGRGGNKRCRNDLLRASGYALRVPSYRDGYPPIARAYLAATTP